jgi:hypothetical protein
VRASVKAYFVRKWFADNGVMPELSDITAQDSDGNPRVQFWHEQKSHIEALMKSMAGLTAGLQAIQAATNKVASDAGIQGGGMGGGFGGGMGGGGDFGDGSDFGGGGGGTEFSGGGDLASDDLGLGNPQAGPGGESGIESTEESSQTKTGTPGQDDDLDLSGPTTPQS